MLACNMESSDKNKSWHYELLTRSEAEHSISLFGFPLFIRVDTFSRRLLAKLLARYHIIEAQPNNMMKNIIKRLALMNSNSELILFHGLAAASMARMVVRLNGCM